MLKLLYKPIGISSFKFINQYKWNNNIKKIGHTGTLDPSAKGLLLIATNDDTKLIQFIKGNDKEYVAKGTLGILTNTLDLDSEITKTKPFNVNEKQLLVVLKSFIGEQLQTPPQFSAKKVNGERAYNLSRKGITSDLKPVLINIKSIKLIKFTDDVFTIKVRVSKGTYIRQLINDIGIKLDTYATMSYLERTEISGLSLEDLDTTIDVSNILNIATETKNKISDKELKNLLNGNLFSNNWKAKTLLIYKSIPICIVEKERAIKVFPQNINSFL